MNCFYFLPIDSYQSKSDGFIFRSFFVNIESFIYATGIITGNFNGTVFKPNGPTEYISAGKFEAKLK
jgi:hypothetical protein